MIGDSFSRLLRSHGVPNLVESWWNWRIQPTPLSEAQRKASEWREIATMFPGNVNEWRAPLAQATADVEREEMRWAQDQALGLGGAALGMTRLPMDAASRYLRANRMGADLTAPYYRAHAGDPARGVPSHWSRSREHASEFMGRAGFQRSDIEKQMLTGYLLPSRPFDPTKTYPLSDLYAYSKAVSDIYGPGAIRHLIGGTDQRFRSLGELAEAAKAQPHAPGMHGSDIFAHWESRFLGRMGLPHSATPMRRAGFDYAMNYRPKSPEIVLFNPAVMRLDQAAFDPRRWRSSNWLAGAFAAPLIAFDREASSDEDHLPRHLRVFDKQIAGP